MPELLVIIVCWGILLVAAGAYAYRARHPAMRPLAAVLIFATVFSAAALVLLFAIAALGEALSLRAWLSTPPGTVVYLLLVFVPAFLLARWQLRRPPRSAPPID